jgi:hypothetical protein
MLLAQGVVLSNENSDFFVVVPVKNAATETAPPQKSLHYGVIHPFYNSLCSNS